MSVLSAENLSLSFGDFDLFKGISVSIANDSRIGLIGPNGIGKTSLLLILSGLSQPTSGKVHMARNRRLGYLRQEAVDAFTDRQGTVYAEMLTVFSGLQARQEQLTALETRMAAGEDAPGLLEKYGNQQHAFAEDGGYDYEVNIQRTLTGLGLGKNTWQMPISHLSGGQKTRLLLARLLLEKPDLLILDEPTNHLDIETVDWLESTLKDWQGACLIVSHDRYFLDSVTTTTWEMSRRGIEVYSGNYSSYLVHRQERWEYIEKTYHEEKERLLKEVDFIQKNWVRASTHARALGLLRRLSRDISIIQNYGVMALRDGRKWSEYGLHADRPLDVVEAVRAVNAIALEGNRPPAIRPRLAADRTRGHLVLQAEEATIGYPGHPLFTVSKLILKRGECAALIGPNGAGKTTFLKVLLGQVSPLSGEVRLGASLEIGYFAQVQDHLEPKRTVLEEIIARKEVGNEVARSHLALYLFRGDDVLKPVSALSGGERARLALAILALEGANLLLLDEPTNHMDIPAQEALQAVLESYNGTILLVSHDRYLIDRLATQVWELKQNRLTIFPDTYREYILRGQVASGGSVVRQVLLTPRPLARDNSHQTRKREQAMAQLEDRIRAQEVAIKELSDALQKSGTDFERSQKLGWQIAKAQAELEKLMGEWEKLAA
jgi:ATP-binding cassette subfamily F protein 3